MVLALTVMVSVSGSSLKGLLGAFGYLMSLVGIGPTSGLPRFHYGASVLYGGFETVTMAMGVFAIAEVLTGLEESRKAVTHHKIEKVFPSLRDIQQTLPSMFEEESSGSFLGCCPDATCNPAFISYDVERKSRAIRSGLKALEGGAPESATTPPVPPFVPLFR
jgi:putative tricarboxylic transport membrane protein